MSTAQFRKVFGKTHSGRFVVSEGTAPSAYILPHVGLPTWYRDTEDDRFETVLLKGTILSLVTDANGDSRFIPANGTATPFTWGDGETTPAGYFSTSAIETGATPASGSGTNVDTVVGAAATVPVGCAQFDAYRPFDKGTSYAVSWIREGFVEWPMVQGINSDVKVGDMVRADFMGRPVKMTLASDAFYLAVGKVIEVEKFATNFDDGLLSYMQLPSDPGALKDVYALTKTGPYSGKLGIRHNLDVVNSLGAIRVALTI